MLAFMLASCQDGATGEGNPPRRSDPCYRRRRGHETVEVEVTRVVEVAGEVAVRPWRCRDQSLSSTSGPTRRTPMRRLRLLSTGIMTIRQEVPQSCAKCHSTPGYIDFLGADGSEPGVVDAAAPIGSVVSARPATIRGDVPRHGCFPSGMRRSPTSNPKRAVWNATRDAPRRFRWTPPLPMLGWRGSGRRQRRACFINIHYYAAAATQYGTHVKGGYEYDGKSYDGRFAHVEPFDTCISCHNPHTLEVQFDECTACHAGLNSAEDLTTSARWRASWITMATATWKKVSSLRSRRCRKC
jgi:hypothetical protein